ncbi:DUF4198 domain-containing protein [Hymenobacter endophyticus]|uniref:DUF4198 domain-containing protein n=1 Tax=Hymenobacter endophyticus TaxID=3076335 RepID=A0ABU3TMB5_9BACT|nr:DUF4198 domain-containing protein [Hymenobacter endophyticus]
MLRRYALLIPLSAVAISALAGQFWLKPARFWVQPGQSVHIRRLTGEHLQGTVWSGTSRRVTGFWHCAPGQPVANLLPAVTAADTLQTTIQLAQPGTHLLALATDNLFVTFSAFNFAAYLQQEGLDYVAARRALAGDTVQPVREAYRRCAKTLVQAGPALPRDTARAWGRVLRLPLELVPEQNPYTLLPGAAFTVRVLRAGQPVAGQQVVLWQRGNGVISVVGRLRSNQNGRILFRLSGAGEYLAGTVRMEPAPKGIPADWQSTWSTLSFGLADKKQR